MTLIIMALGGIVAAADNRDRPGRKEQSQMPMIDVTATEGTFADPQALAGGRRG
jgi:hypothetical protein